MKFTDDFAYLVLSIVAEIPRGCVLTYGRLAMMAGYPKHARLVGQVLAQAHLYGQYPCHRVVNSVGGLVRGWDEQRELLRSEKVTLTKGGKVDLKKHLWQS